MPPEQPEQAPVANTAEHEHVLSEISKEMVAPFLELARKAGKIALETLDDNHADPLAIERFLHLSDLSTQVAHRCYILGEDARQASMELYQGKKKR